MRFRRFRKRKKLTDRQLQCISNEFHDSWFKKRKKLTVEQMQYIDKSFYMPSHRTPFLDWLKEQDKKEELKE